MKPYVIILTGLLFLSTTFMSAQNEVDALRYSQNYPVGTARAVGLGGAVGALGGEFTSLSINPAAIGFYRSSEFSITPRLNWNVSGADFLGNRYTDERYSFDLGNLGMVFNNSSGRENGWISTNFAFGYNQMNKFHQDVFMGGIQRNSSYLDNFVYYAGDLEVESLNSDYEALAWETYMIDWNDAEGTYFNDFAEGGYGQVQERSITRRGGIGEYLFSFGANYSDMLYLGATMGINRVRFEQVVTHFENDPEDIINFTRNFTFEEYLQTRGVGYSFKVGAIFRPVDFIRIGGAFHLPTFYFLRDEYENTMEANIDPGEAITGTQFATGGLKDYRYRLRTPAKAVGSAVITIGKIGLLTADYEFINYQNADLSAGDYNFKQENQDIEAVYRSTHNFRVGGEVRLGPAYFRGGYAYYASPFSNEVAGVDNSNQIISGGIGVRNRFAFIDLSYSRSATESSYFLYVPGVDNLATIDSNANSIMLTLGFRF